MSAAPLARLAFLLFGGGIYVALGRQQRREQVRERLAQVMRPAEAPGPEADAASAPVSAPPPWDGALRRALQRADLRLRPGEFLLLWAACPVLLGTLGAALSRSPVMALLLALIGAALPPLLLRAGEGTRRRRFDGQLPDALTLMVSALRSGFSLARAAQVVAEEMAAPASEEFALALAGVSLGMPMAAALARMAERVGSADLGLIVTAVATQQQTGGNLAEILARIADTIRERVRTQGEIRALTAEGRLSSLILTLLPPVLALLMTLRNPHYFAPLTGTPLGQALIAGAVAGQVVGALLISRMVRLDL